MKNKPNRQAFALKNPYYSPMEFNPGVKKIIHLGNLRISSVLCIDAFLSEPAWHASGAILDEKMMPKKLIGHVPVNDFQTLINHLTGLLEPVGCGERWTHKSSIFKKNFPLTC
jgi:hypothetical protein